MVDYHIWPFYERIPAISEVTGVDLLPAASFPRITAWFDAMENLEAVKKCRLSNELHKHFITTYRAGNPQYDFELTTSPASATELDSKL